MKKLFLIIALLIIEFSALAQMPSCCSQPGACQSLSDPLWTGDINHNGINVSYLFAQSRGYLLLPNHSGDTVYSSHGVTQQTLYTAFWFSLQPKLQLTGRLPVRYIKNNDDDIYGIGDVSAGILWNTSGFLKLKEPDNLMLQFNLNIPSGRANAIDTAQMYKTLLQTGSGNLNTDLGIRFNHIYNFRHTFTAIATVRQSIYHIRNYKNASLFTANIAYVFKQQFSEHTEAAYQVSLQGERYLRDFVNGDVAYNSGYIMALLIPRVRVQHQSLQYIAQANIPLYRHYFGHQLKLSNTFTTGFNYVF